MTINEPDRQLLELSRMAIREYLINEETIDPPSEGPDWFYEKRGVFCTLKKDGALRGCIGYPEPIFPLAQAIIKASISAATGDPRFPNVTQDELSVLMIELTILTPPKLLEVDNPTEYSNHIEVGKHGLIAALGGKKGLLLPQVPVEQNWNAQKFLEHTCSKAWLSPSAYKRAGFELYTFTGRIIKEEDLE